METDTLTAEVTQKTGPQTEDPKVVKQREKLEALRNKKRGSVAGRAAAEAAKRPTTVGRHVGTPRLG